MIAGFLAEQPGLHVEAEHLQRVTLHLWSARRIVDVPVRPKEGDDTKQADEAS